MKYTPATFVKAAIAVIFSIFGAAAAGANGADLSVLDLGQWLTAIGTGLIAGGAVFHNPSKTSATDQAVATVQDVITKTVDAHKELTQQAVDSIKAVQDAVGGLTGLLPPPVAQALESVTDEVWSRPLGPLAQQVLSRLPNIGP